MKPERLPTTRPLAALLCAIGLLAGACGDSAGAAIEVHATERSDDPRVVRARDALEWGRAGEARGLVAQIGDSAGIESFLLRARLAFLVGDDVAAFRELEGARRAWPEDVRVPATAAELYAADGRIDAAREEVVRGAALDPHSSDLVRAGGIVKLAQQGGAAAGVADLERALAADPELPYVRRARREGYVLLTRQALTQGDAVAAVEAAREAHAEDPDDPEVRELLAEAYAAVPWLDRAIPLYGQLLAEGRDVGTALAHLHKRAATEAILEAADHQARGELGEAEHRRGVAIEHWMLARDLGLPDAALGHGVEALREEARVRDDLGVRAYEGGDYPRAQELFELALRYDPQCLAALSHLGSIHLNLQEWDAAEARLSECWELAQLADEELPEPVHVKLAYVLDVQGRRVDAIALLRAYLDERPDGQHLLVTESALERFGG